MLCNRAVYMTKIGESVIWIKKDNLLAYMPYQKEKKPTIWVVGFLCNNLSPGRRLILWYSPGGMRLKWRWG